MPKTVSIQVPEKLCLNCGKPFAQTRKDKKFCRYQCGNSYWQKENRKKIKAEKAQDNQK